jgi:hypothetical protein
MRVLDKRLRRLEVRLLPPAETDESRRMHEVVMDIRRRRAARLGLPVPGIRSRTGLARHVPRRHHIVGAPEKRSTSMIRRGLARWLERLENRLMPAKEEPLAFVIVAVSADGQIGDRFRLTPTGLQKLQPSPDGCGG